MCVCVRQADAPNTGLIPESDAVGVTVVLITCTYRGQEFIRIGYYVNNEYTDAELRENPPLKPNYSQVRKLKRDHRLHHVDTKVCTPSGLFNFDPELWLVPVRRFPSSRRVRMGVSSHLPKTYQ